MKDGKYNLPLFRPILVYQQRSRHGAETLTDYQWAKGVRTWVPRHFRRRSTFSVLSRRG